MPRPALVLCAACLLVACSSSGTVDVDGQDGSAFFPTVRVELPLGRGGAREGARPRWDGALELSYTRGSGDDAQRISSGQNIRFGGVTIPGPATVASELDLRVVTLAYRHALRELSPAGGPSFTLLAGFGLPDSRVILQAPGQALAEEDLDLYAWGGLELSGEVSRRLRAWGRIELPLLGDTMLGQMELGGELGLGSVAIFAGWRYLDYTWVRSGSDVVYTLSGPMIGVRIRP